MRKYKNNKTGLCNICNQEKNDVKPRRYPIIFKNDFCDECYENEVRSTNRNSIKILCIGIIPLLIACIVSFFIKVEDEFPTIAYCLTYTWMGLALIFSYTKIPMIFSSKEFYDAYMNPDKLVFMTPSQAETNSLIFMCIIVLKFLIRLILSMLYFAWVLLLNIVILTNTILIIKKVSDKYRIMVYIVLLLIVVSIFVVLSIFVISGL